MTWNRAASAVGTAAGHPAATVAAPALGAVYAVAVVGVERLQR